MMLKIHSDLKNEQHPVSNDEVPEAMIDPTTGIEIVDQLETPPLLTNTVPFAAKTPLPNLEKPQLDTNKSTFLYTYYNLDPNTRSRMVSVFYCWNLPYLLKIR